MQAYIQQLTGVIGFPAEATDYFCGLYAAAKANPQAEQALDYLKHRMLIGRVMDNVLNLMADVQPALERLAEALHVHPYSAAMLTVLYALPPLQEKYHFLGFDDAFFYENMEDITCKLQECKQVYGVWGTSVFQWFYRHFAMHTLMFGRFQYERIPFTKAAYTFGEHTIRPGNLVYNIHIPSKGPMTEAARLDSYKRLYDYAAPKNGVLPITCTSWLLCPSLLEICRPDSNMVGFIKDFEIIDRSLPTAEHPFSNAWRVFGMDYTGDTSVLPQNTDLQRRIAQWLARGKGIGGGTGILLFDGEKILNKKA